MPSVTDRFPFAGANPTVRSTPAGVADDPSRQPQRPTNIVNVQMAEDGPFVPSLRRGITRQADV